MVLLRVIDGDWKIIPEEEKQPNDLYLDGKLYERLKFARSQLAHNNDAGGLICGKEGSGKSSLAGNIMRYMSLEKFNLKDHLIKDYESALEVLEHARKGDCIMFDESYLLFSSTEVMQKSQRDLVKIFSIIRQRGLFFLIVGPSFFRINSYFALDRTRFMINVYMKKNERGFFSYFGDKKKAKLFMMGKKEHNYLAVKPNFRGRFTKCSLLENAEYKEDKEETLNASFKIAKEKKVKSRAEFEREMKKEWMQKLIDAGVKQTAIAKAFDLAPETICRWKNKEKHQEMIKI